MRKNISCNMENLCNMCLYFILFAIPCVLLFFAFPYIIKIFLPFIIGTCFYFAAKPFHKFFIRRRIPAFVSAIASLIIISVVFGTFTWIVFSRIIKELFSFSDSFSEMYTAASNVFLSTAEKLNAFSRANFSANGLSSNINAITSKLGSSFKNQLNETISSISAALIKCAKNLPNIAIILFTAYLSSFFMLKDHDEFVSFIKKLFGERAYKIFVRIKSSAYEALGSYIRAQLSIGCIMFFVLLAGFLILHVKYALLFALVTAVVDAVPILGTGSILIPWSVFRIFSDNPSLGWGLLCLYGICVLTRQLCEPKIIGVQLGIHPLAAIFSIYVGMKLLGFSGLIMGPAAALTVKNILFPVK